MKKTISFFRSFLVQCLLVSAMTAPCFAQSSTVGDATRFLFEQGKSASYGIVGGDVGGSQFGQELFTRHKRQGNNLGIGGSSLETTNATSESGSASIAPFSVTQTHQESPRAGENLGSAIQSFGTTSPALSGFTIAPSTGMYSGSGLTSSYGDSNYGATAPASLYQDLNAVPSFSKSGSRMSLPSASTNSGSSLDSNTESGSLLHKGDFQY